MGIVNIKAAVLAYIVLLAALTAPAISQDLVPASAQPAPGAATATQFPPAASAAPAPNPAVPAPTNPSPVIFPAAPPAAASPESTAAIASPSPIPAETSPLPSPEAPVTLPTLPSPAAAASPSPAAVLQQQQQQQQQPTPAGPAGTFNLLPFNSIVSCVPFNVLVTPNASSDAPYSVTTAVNAEVDAAVRVQVVNNTLYLGFNRSFDSHEVIKVNVSMPAQQLQRVTNRGLGDIILNPGFNTTSSVIVAQGTGRVLARGINTSDLQIVTGGTADVFAKGAIKTANVTSDGVGRVTLAGVEQSVAAQLSGITSLFVDAASDGTTITAKAPGISKILYTRGKCDAGKQVSIDVPFFSMDLGLSSCVKVAPEAFPRYKATWSCGVRVRGAALCTPDADASQAAASSSADISVSGPSIAASSVSISSSDTDGNGVMRNGVDGDASTAEDAAGSDESAVDASQTEALRLQQAEAANNPAVAEAAGAADISVAAFSGPSAGRKLHSHGLKHRRSLSFLDMPMIWPAQPHPWHTGDPTASQQVSASSSSHSWGDNDNGVTVTTSISGVDGSGRSSRVTRRSLECTAALQDLYIPAQ